MTDGEWLHPSNLILQEKLKFHFQMCHTLHNVLHNNTYWEIGFSLYFGFVNQMKNKLFILNWVLKLLVVTFN